jgi:uncharacterized membrane protein
MNIPDNRDLVTACLWAAATMVIVAVTDSVLLRAVLGLPMALFVPGHVLLRAIGIRTSSALEHLIYAIGASLATAVVGGFALNVVNLLMPLGWAVWFFAATAGASLIAARRRDAPDPPAWSWPTGFRFGHVTAFVLAASLTTGAYALAVSDEAKQQQFKYTEFWMVPSTEGGHLSVGIQSGEVKTQQFDLEISVEGRPFAVLRSLVVAPGERWAREISVPKLATPQRAEARLYRSKDDRLYRSVSALVPGS